MWLTGDAGGPPIALEAPVMAHLRALSAGIGELSAVLGTRVHADAASLLCERATTRGLRRHGRTSANGTCRLVRAIDNWVAVTVARDADRELVPAMTGTLQLDPWEAIERAARGLSARELGERGQLVGLPAAELAPAGIGTATPFRVARLGAPAGSANGLQPRVVDFSAMWAGPLCAHLLGVAGASVIKVEDPERPDGARVGDPALFARLHAGHGLASVGFTTSTGRREIHELVSAADVVIEASRPRALEQLGLSPQRFLGARPGRTWISITGYGRSGPRANHVAFGDDAAVAGGLVAWVAPDAPVFCADAVADPISGLYAAFGGLGSIVARGGYLVDVSMSASSSFVLHGPRCAGRHAVGADPAGEWWVSHDDVHQQVLPP